MNATMKTAIAAMLVAVLAIVPFVAAESSADDTEITIDKDLGVIWSLGYQFNFTGSGATTIQWDFGDGSEILYDDSSDGADVNIWNPAHYFPGPGVYYITLTTYNSYDPDGDGVGSYTTSVYKLDVRGFPYVTLIYNNGEPDGRIQQTSGESNAVPAEEPDDPVRAGYTFSGWYTDETCETPYDWSEDVTEPITLYAGWTQNPEYTVTFDVGGGSVQLEPVSVVGGLTYELPAYDGTYEGHEFGGWQVDGQTYMPGQSITVNGPVTVTAVWNLDSYTVSFETEGGVPVPDSQTVPYGGTVTEPDFTPERTGYTFDGWYLNGEPFDFDTVIEGSIVLTAHWTPIQITVTFDPDNGQSTWTESVAYGTAVSEPADDPVRTNYRFTGWYLGSTPYTFTTPVTQAITLTAHWEYVNVPPTYEYYSVSFDADGGTPQPGTQTVREGLTAIEPVNQPTKDGFTFDGWYLGDELYDFDSPVNDDIELVAHWTPIEVPPTGETHTVTYDLNHDGLIQTMSVSDGERALSFTPTFDGYRFDGWFLDDVAFDFSQRVRGDITLTANWTQIHTVTIDESEGGSFEPIDGEVVNGDSIRLPDATNGDKVLKGWDTDGDDKEDAQPGDLIEITDDTVLKPIWDDRTEDDPVQHRIIIVDAAELGFDTWWTEGDTEITLPEIDRDGKVLAGWDIDGTTYQPGDSYLVTADVTITADWEDAPIVNVGVDPDGGTVAGDIGGEMPAGSDIVLPDVSKPGQELAGWDTDGDGYADAQPGDVIEITEDTTLAPVWEGLGEDDVQHEITIDADGGDSPYESWWPVDGETVPLPTPSRDGYEFVGWDTDGDGTADVMPGQEWRPTQDSTVKAVWTESDEPVPGDDDSDEPSVWYLVGAVVCAFAAAVLAILFWKQDRDWFVLVGLIVAIVAAILCALFYAEVL